MCSGEYPPDFPFKLLQVTLASRAGAANNAMKMEIQKVPHSLNIFISSKWRLCLS
jgi:hypothetical protein